MAKSTGKVAVRKEPATEVAKASPERALAHPFVSLRREVEKLFDDFAAGLPSWMRGRDLFDDRLWRLPRLDVKVPAVDATETDKEWRITAELPGIEEKDLEVSVTDDMLTIKGEKREEKDESRRDFRLSERHYGMFQRSFGLPPGVEADRIEARFAKGVLTITMPKSAQARKQARKIKVDAG